MTDETPHGECWLQGRAIVSGIAIGLPFFLQESSPKSSDTSRPSFSLSDELARLASAFAHTQHELNTLVDKLSSDGFCQEAKVIETQAALAEDTSLRQEIENAIQTQFLRAEEAVREVAEEFKARFELLPEVVFRQRFDDVDSICQRLIAFLTMGGYAHGQIPKHAVVFAKSVTPSIAVEMSVHGIGALVTKHGGPMSHTAIVAKARGIPYVSGIDESSMVPSREGGRVIVDGLAGLVIVNPTNETMTRYTDLVAAHDRCLQENADATHTETRTKDGQIIALLANVSGVPEMKQVSAFGLDGVGLYRTEYQVLEHRRFPSEAEQAASYAEMVQLAEGKPLVIRAFDFSSDKGWEEVWDVLPNVKEGRRATSLLLDHPNVFQAHLRAIIRASRYGPLSILFPMVSSIGEMEQCKRLVQEAWSFVCTEKEVPFPRIGAMIELPALAFQARELASMVDFLAIGTNDLIQYALAVDRSNTACFDPNLSYHPGLLHLLAIIVRESTSVGVGVCVCGEMASDLLLTPFLIGVGFRQLSMVPRLAPMVRHLLRSLTIQECATLAREVLAMDSPETIRACLREWYCRNHGVLQCQNV